jgi:hypothetical protein
MLVESTEKVGLFHLIVILIQTRASFHQTSWRPVTFLGQEV